MLDFRKLKTRSAFGRQNQVKISDLITPGYRMPVAGAPDDLIKLSRRIATARSRSAPVIVFIGAHVIKCGMSLYIIDLIRRGFITHIAGNGAVSIHDFELAYLGATSEDVPKAIDDGSFGMWEETGAWINSAIKSGYQAGNGYGKSIADYMEGHTGDFPHRDSSVIYSAFKYGIPATVHVTIGTDITHQHPSADFSAIGGTSGTDFKSFCESVSQLEGGVFLNFGSAVTGPEVFLKALSISRNLGYETRHITTANFDLRPLGDYRSNIGYDDPDYYYRPRKNIVNRPTQNGGKGYHLELDHKVSIPLLHSLLTSGA